jgi:serine/threonine protein phosphatase PrpC
LIVQMELATLSRRGGRNYNEDACGHWHSDSHLCCVVADGAGGTAAATRRRSWRCSSSSAPSPAIPEGTPEAIEQVIVATNRSIIQHRADDRSVQNMHSTVVALFIDFEARAGMWGHCGDSRLYVFRAGKVAARTRDHSLVQSLVDGGMLAAEDMRSHPQRSELLSALGVGDEDLQVSVSAPPWQVEAGDAFLLCTDGMWEYVEDAQMESALTQGRQPERMAAGARAERAAGRLAQAAPRQLHRARGLGQPAGALIEGRRRCRIMCAWEPCCSAASASPRARWWSFLRTRC